MGMSKPERLLEGFLRRMEQKYAGPPMPNEWTVQQKNEAEYWLAPSPGQRQTNPSGISFDFEPRQNIITVNLLVHHEKNIRLFPRMYEEWKRYLEDNRHSCFLRTNAGPMYERFGPKRALGLDPVGTEAASMYRLLESAQAQIDGSPPLFFSSQGGMLLYSKQVADATWLADFAPPNAIGIKGRLFRSTEEIGAYFAPVRKRIEQAKASEQRLLRFLDSLTGRFYYEPQSESVVLFQRHLAFSCKVLMEGEGGYCLRFGAKTASGRDIHEAENTLKTHMQRYYQKERLRALAEGRN